MKINILTRTRKISSYPDSIKKDLKIWLKKKWWWKGLIQSKLWRKLLNKQLLKRWLRKIQEIMMIKFQILKSHQRRIQIQLLMLSARLSKNLRSQQREYLEIKKITWKAVISCLQNRFLPKQIIKILLIRTVIRKIENLILGRKC